MADNCRSVVKVTINPIQVLNLLLAKVMQKYNYYLKLDNGNKKSNELLAQVLFRTIEKQVKQDEFNCGADFNSIANSQETNYGPNIDDSNTICSSSKSSNYHFVECQFVTDEAKTALPKTLKNSVIKKDNNDTVEVSNSDEFAEESTSECDDSDDVDYKPEDDDFEKKTSIITRFSREEMLKFTEYAKKYSYKATLNRWPKIGSKSTLRSIITLSEKGYTGSNSEKLALIRMFMVNKAREFKTQNRIPHMWHFESWAKEGAIRIKIHNFKPSTEFIDNFKQTCGIQFPEPVDYNSLDNQSNIGQFSMDVVENIVGESENALNDMETIVADQNYSVSDEFIVNNFNDDEPEVPFLTHYPAELTTNSDQSNQEDSKAWFHLLQEKNAAMPDDNIDYKPE